MDGLGDGVLGHPPRSMRRRGRRRLREEVAILSCLASLSPPALFLSLSLLIIRKRKVYIGKPLRDDMCQGPDWNKETHPLAHLAQASTTLPCSALFSARLSGLAEAHDWQGSPTCYHPIPCMAVL